MNSTLLASAKKDIPLYFNDFKDFWDATTTHISEEELIDCYANTLIFRNWQLSLNHVGIQHLDSILSELHEDINTSFFLAHFGQYRTAIMHLRSVIELSLQLLYFYQHEVEFSQWKDGEFRIKHEELTEYLKKHPQFIGTSAVNLIGNITQNWKTFSKYIHAEAPSYFQTTLESSTKKTIIIKDFNIWKSHFLKTGYRINKLFSIFFRDKIVQFPTQSKDLLLRNLLPNDITEIGLVP
ncbi:hypothetical protein EYY60_15770 [Flavobacterium zhairuonense]|uniref:hypothetical protein n=1 Tax=Flavobacterium zhairuonense TaxID=2493631 RepID=UPI0010511C78|nr:hypothetical protein [Flavobacterium zhairuonense]KAF2508584.1 hypothetical protein EYY60_15770 [Flavobacterium zhairuonense]